MLISAHLHISTDASYFFYFYFYFFCKRHIAVAPDTRWWKKSDVQLDGANTDGFDRCENVAAVGTALTFPSKKLSAGVATRYVTEIISELRQQHLFTDVKEFLQRRFFILHMRCARRI